ncbi:hypothetical protein E2C01_090002 [Portunus trituberculatus]|uniref:Uncharacterized protein n=1 Tax=Portunus trituberculatus TaxID=210409 RepID=A0A5B7JKS1_PORTR|nr:hypothetical protein [Portunus trituberculatus]
MIKDVHQFISTTLGDISVSLATIYMLEMNTTRLMPWVVVDQSSSLGPITLSQVYETMNLLGNFPHFFLLLFIPTTQET